MFIVIDISSVFEDIKYYFGYGLTLNRLVSILTNVVTNLRVAISKIPNTVELNTYILKAVYKEMVVESDVVDNVGLDDYQEYDYTASVDYALSTFLIEDLVLRGAIVEEDGRYYSFPYHFYMLLKNNNLILRRDSILL